MITQCRVLKRRSSSGPRQPAPRPAAYKTTEWRMRRTARRGVQRSPRADPCPDLVGDAARARAGDRRLRAAVRCSSLYLGLKGGGYDLVVRSEVGIAVWWIVLLGALVGVLPGGLDPARRLGRRSACSPAFAVWTALGIGWSESAERSVAELGRVATYLGVFALALAIAGPRGPAAHGQRGGGGDRRRSACWRCSRACTRPGFRPTRPPPGFPRRKARAQLPAQLLERARGADRDRACRCCSVAAHQARSLLAQALAAAALPAMALAGFYTLSRGGAIELGVGAGRSCSRSTRGGSRSLPTAARRRRSGARS